MITSLGTRGARHPDASDAGDPAAGLEQLSCRESGARASTWPRQKDRPAPSEERGRDPLAWRTRAKAVAVGCLVALRPEAALAATTATGGPGRRGDGLALRDRVGAEGTSRNDLPWGRDLREVGQREVDAAWERWAAAISSPHAAPRAGRGWAGRLYAWCQSFFAQASVGGAAADWALAPAEVARPEARGGPGALRAPRRRLGEEQSVYVNPLCTHLPNIADGTWIMKRHGIIEFCNINSFRANDVVRQLELLDREHPELPEFDPVLVCSRDTVYQCRDAMPNRTLPGPVTMAFSRDKRNQDGVDGVKVVLVPDSVFWDWHEVGIDDFELTAATLRERGQHPAHKQVAGWVGNPKTNPIRPKLLDIAKEHPDDIEAIGMDWRPARDGGPHLAWTSGGMSLPDQISKWAYLIDVMGRGYSFRVKLFFHSRRPILWQTRPWEEFYSDKLQPFVHYVPVAEDLSDLPDKVRWLKAHPDNASAIAGNALSFARHHITRRAAQARWLEALWEVIEVQHKSVVSDASGVAR